MFVVVRIFHDFWICLKDLEFEQDSCVIFLVHEGWGERKTFLYITVSLSNIWVIWVSYTLVSIQVRKISALTCYTWKIFKFLFTSYQKKKITISFWYITFLSISNLEDKEKNGVITELSYHQYEKQHYCQHIFFKN